MTAVTSNNSAAKLVDNGNDDQVNSEQPRANAFHKGCSFSSANYVPYWGRVQHCKQTKSLLWLWT